MVYLIENYQISWQEMLGCRNFPFGLNRTPFKSLGESFSSQWLKILESSHSELPMPWVTTRPISDLTHGGLRWSLVRPSGPVNGSAEFYTICSKATGSVGQGPSVFKYVRFWSQPLCTSAMTTPGTPCFGFLPKEVGLPRGTSFIIWKQDLIIFYNLETRAEVSGSQNTFSRTHALIPPLCH